jgi:hypothetical protein
MKILDQISRARAVSVPILAVTTSDQWACERSIKEKCNGSVPVIAWNCVSGACGLNQSGLESLLVACEGANPADVTMDAVSCLSVALKLPERSILIMHSMNRLLENAAVVQAVSNVRDVFKSDGRTLLMMGSEFSLPADLRNDVVSLDEPLPDSVRLQAIVSELLAAAALECEAAIINEAVEALSGLSEFAAEQAAAMSLSPAGLDIDMCWAHKKALVEQTKGLSMEPSKITYASIGGNDAIKRYFADIFHGPKSPCLVVQFEEIEKLLAGAQGDTSGTSQDQLAVLLDKIESNGWLGCLFLGHAGTGKSYFSNAIAGEFGVRRIVFDTGACKGELVGKSEGQIRAALKVISSIGGERVLVVGTCNKLESLPAALKRRFSSAGMWFFDLPSVEEKQSIWKIQLQAHGFDSSEALTCDDGWSAANIRDCCRSAYFRNLTVWGAAHSVVSALSQDPQGVEDLRRMASGRFLSVSYSGPYKYQVTINQPSTGRRIGGVE